MKLTALAIALFSSTALAQSPAHSTAIGTWRGTSTCLVRPSSCNDEVVVYRITPLKGADSVAIDASKIISGAEDQMGILSCAFTPANGQITCAIPQGVWRFTVRGDSLTGELRRPDNSRFRDVRASRSH